MVKVTTHSQWWHLMPATNGTMEMTLVLHTLLFMLYLFLFAQTVLICTLEAIFSYIRHHAPEVIDLQIKDITEICKEHSSSNSLTQKLIKFHKYASQYTKSGRIFLSPSLNILTIVE